MRAAIVALATFLLIAVIFIRGVQAFSSASARLTVRYRTTRSLQRSFSKVEQESWRSCRPQGNSRNPRTTQHYGDRRRFLAVQAAAATTESISIDFADLRL